MLFEYNPKQLKQTLCNKGFQQIFEFNGFLGDLLSFDELKECMVGKFHQEELVPEDVRSILSLDDLENTGNTVESLKESFSNALDAAVLGREVISLCIESDIEGSTIAIMTKGTRIHPMTAMRHNARNKVSELIYDMRGEIRDEYQRLSEL